ncbi:Lar family restriction alleviation protein [Paraburkholderia tropica]|uniref:dATP/dGTP pyrophosphohydrolase domain-containing protein n=1 Tax=Paraburkholderia tropica TaxID=92647 RepID=UPI001619AD60|nr:dATP/dGTP pyrophosphohydrolase domain-containing protein [Paraburkholderia tropica]MBB3004433.1 Lar family restriction alleviation protein [Paraburkholderia tropica]
MDNQLKPCPFCGSRNISEGEVLSTNPNGAASTQSMCRECGALGPEAHLRDGEVDFGDEKATTAWNTRAALPSDSAGAPLTDVQRAAIQAAVDTASRVLRAGGDGGDELSDAGLRRELKESRDMLRDMLADPVAPAAPFDMLAHLARQREFSERTFGPGARTKGVCDHIRKELVEIESNPADLTEWIDVVILALDGAWRAGGSPQQIIDAIVAKQTKNEGRTWPDWRTVDPNKAIEHDRSHDTCAQCEGKGTVLFREPEDAWDMACGMCDGTGRAARTPTVAADAAAPISQGSTVDVDAETVKMVDEEFWNLIDTKVAQPDDNDVACSSCGLTMAESRTLFALKAQPDDRAALPAGWKLVRVNQHFDALIEALEHAESKGYLPDALKEEWASFACDENVAQPDERAAAPQAALTDEQLAGLAYRNCSKYGDNPKREYRSYTFGVRALRNFADSLLATPPTERMSDAMRDVIAERGRQVSGEGFTPTRDDSYADGQLAQAGAAYAIAVADHTNHIINSGAAFYTRSPDIWPWSEKWWKPTNPRRALVKAAALILAEIERIDRAARKAEIERSGEKS